MTNTVRPREYAACRPERHHDYLWPVLRRVLAGVPPGARILDLGCGSGYLSGRLADEGYAVTGVDASESGVRAAREALPELSFFTASVTDPDLAAQVGKDYDLVLAVEVVEHLYAPAAFCKTCRALLREDGMLVVTTPYHGYLKNLAMAVTGQLDRHHQPASEGGHIKFWSRQSLTDLLDGHGFDVLAFHGAGRFPLLWKSMVLTARQGARAS